MATRNPVRLAALVVAGLIAATSLPTASQAEPGGCLKYGAVGAVGGHLAHHGVMGAAGGCAVGMYQRHKFRKQERAKASAYDREHQSGEQQGPPPGYAPRP